MSEKAKWEKLNAHVDGELDADDAVEIADAAANDPAVAHDLAALTHVKAVLADSIDAPDLEIPRGGVTGEKTYWLRNVAAAVTVLAVGAAALFHIVSSNMGSTSGTQWIATAHNEWVVATERKDTMAMPRTVGSSVPRTGAGLHTRPFLGAASCGACWTTAERRSARCPHRWLPGDTRMYRDTCDLATNRRAE